MSGRALKHGQNEENSEGQNQHGNSSCWCQRGHLNMDKKKRTVKDKISMTMALFQCQRGHWLWTKRREQWMTKSAWWWPLLPSGRLSEHGQNEENNERQNEHGRKWRELWRTKSAQWQSGGWKGTWTWTEWRAHEGQPAWWWSRVREGTWI